MELSVVPLLLCAPGTDYAGPVVLVATAGSVAKAVENAGRAALRRQLAARRAAAAQHGHHHHHHHRHHAENAADDADSDSGSESGSDSGGSSAFDEEDDHYAVLGLTEDATDDQIRTRYRRLILKYHPDKEQNANGSSESGGGGGAAPSPTSAAARFLAVQKAYDVLSDPAKKRSYDSTLDFDDDIPSGNENLKNDAAFFALYGPVFARNSRFSVQRPVPQLGGPADDDATVAAFYKFWFNFDSWRDFSGEGEHDPDSAEQREEKRWMERENARAAAKKKKAEVARVADLVARAHARDPRVARLRKAEEDAKAAAREAKAAAKRAAEEEAARKAAEEEAARKAAEEAAKAEAAARKTAKERERKAAKRAEKELRKAAAEAASAGAPAGSLPTDGDLDALVAARDASALCAVLQTVAAAAGSGAGTGAAAGEDAGGYAFPAVAVTPANAAAVAAALAAAVAVVAEEARAAAAAKAASAAAAAPAASSSSKPAEGHPWSVLELSLLSKAVARFPPGTRNRWVAIADYVNTVGHNSILRSADECIAKAKSVGEEDRRAASTQAFATYNAMLHSKPKKDTEFHDKDEVKPAVAFSTGGGEATAPAAAAAATSAATPAAAAAAAAPKAAAAAPAPAAAVAAPAAAAPAAAAAAAAPVDPEMGVWSPEDQKLFEAALRTFPASLDKNERWAKVAGAVPGKTKKQCVARFKFLREQVLASKGGATS